MRIAPLLILLSSLCVADARPQGLDPVAPERADEIVEFLRARADAWDREFPGPIEWSEWDENSIGAIAWRGYYDNTKMNAEKTDYPLGVNREEADALAGHRAALLASNGEWLIVERPIPDDPEAPWIGVEAKECPTRHWASTMLYGMRFPLYRKTVSEYMRLHDAINVLEEEDKVVIDFAAFDFVAEAFRTEEYSSVGGCYGAKVTFERAADWRPTIIRECFSLDMVPEPKPGADPVELETVDFGGLESVVLHRYDWLDWVALGDVKVPTRRLVDHRIRIGEQETFLLHSVFESEFEASALAKLPDNVSFARIPPESMGPVGSVSNRETGEVRLYDARTLSERLSSREEFVERVSEVSAGGVPEGSGWGGGLLRTTLLILGIGMIAWAVGQRVLGGGGQGS